MPALRHQPILFDLDGTLIDSSLDIAAAVNRTMQDLDLPELPHDEIIGYVGDGVRKLMRRVFAKHGCPNLDEAVRAFKADYLSNCLGQTRPYPGIEDLLDKLRPYKLAVVTNKPVAMARRILAGLRLDGHFSAVVGGVETPIKPLPDPLHLALSRLGEGTQGGLMVGDHPNDILAGRAAGLATCGVCWGFDEGRAIVDLGPDKLVRKPAELSDWLLGQPPDGQSLI